MMIPPRKILAGALHAKRIPHGAVAGLCVGVVVEDKDPENLERYKVWIPGINEKDEEEFDICAITTGNAALDVSTGLFAVRQALAAQRKTITGKAPLINADKLPYAPVSHPGSPKGGMVHKYKTGDTVWVVFENGDTNRPVITGTYYSFKDLGITKAEKAPPPAEVPESPPVVPSGTVATNYQDISKKPDKAGVYECIRRTEQILGIPEDHLAAIAWKESGFNNNARNVSEIEYSTSAFQVNSRAHPSFLYGGPIQTAGPIIQQQQTKTKTNLVKASAADWAQIVGGDPKKEALLNKTYAEGKGVVGQESPQVEVYCPYSSAFAGCFLLANYKSALKSGLTGEEAWRKAFERYNGSGQAAVNYSYDVQNNVKVKPWKGRTSSVSSTSASDGASSPLRRSASVFSTLKGFGTSGGAKGASEQRSNRREYHSSGPEISGHTSPEGHKLLFYDGPDDDDPNSKNEELGQEKIILQTIFGHRFYLIDRPIEDRRIEIDTIGGHFIRLYDGNGSAGKIQISDPKGNTLIITSADDTLTIKTNQKIVLETEEYELSASRKAEIKSPHITLTSGDIKLGGPGASRPLSLRGTIDTGGYADTANLSTNVKGI